MKLDRHAGNMKPLQKGNKKFMGGSDSKTITSVPLNRHTQGHTFTHSVSRYVHVCCCGSISQSTETDRMSTVHKLVLILHHTET